jgi:hypothetical protein
MITIINQKISSDALQNLPNFHRDECLCIYPKLRAPRDRCSSLEKVIDIDILKDPTMAHAQPWKITMGSNGMSKVSKKSNKISKDDDWSFQMC